jgi:hypothetical protein
MYQLHPVITATLAEQRRRDLLASAHLSRLTRQARRTASAAPSPSRGGWARQLLAYAR